MILPKQNVKFCNMNAIITNFPCISIIINISREQTGLHKSTNCAYPVNYTDIETTDPGGQDTSYHR